MQGFVEIKIGVAPDQSQFLANITQPKRKQYCLENHIMSTIHADMRYTLQSMATEIYQSH